MWNVYIHIHIQCILYIHDNVHISLCSRLSTAAAAAVIYASSTSTSLLDEFVNKWE